MVRVARHPDVGLLDAHDNGGATDLRYRSGRPLSPDAAAAASDGLGGDRLAIWPLISLDVCVG